MTKHGEPLNVANQRYLAIIYDFIKPEHVSKLLNWVSVLSEEHKKVSEPY